MKKCRVGFDEVIALTNLCAAWEEFIRGKGMRQDVKFFKRHLGDNIVALHESLRNGDYRHGGYDFFTVADPKPRNIHKASVRDRLLHHALHRKLYPHFSSKFIASSFSCQTGKGLHLALATFGKFGRQISRNNTVCCWVLKCDIRKFFDSIDHRILIGLLAREIYDYKLLNLLVETIYSFEASPGRGLPLGNLTSQLFANIYMNEFDQFVKQELRFNHYVRYADDFVFLTSSRTELLMLIPRIQKYLEQVLHLTLHPKKIFIKTLDSGVDFLGWVHFSHHHLPRGTTKRRVIQRSQQDMKLAAFQSYLGLLQHGDTFGLRQKIENNFWLWGEHVQADPALDFS